MRYRCPRCNTIGPYERVEERSQVVDRTPWDLAGGAIGVLSFAAFFLAVWLMFS